LRDVIGAARITDPNPGCRLIHLNVTYFTVSKVAITTTAMSVPRSLKKTWRHG
jgi:hypothetical protein